MRGSFIQSDLGDQRMGVTPRPRPLGISYFCCAIVVELPLREIGQVCDSYFGTLLPWRGVVSRGRILLCKPRDGVFPGIPCVGHRPAPLMRSMLDTIGDMPR